jgi:hypothetical protein
MIVMPGARTHMQSGAILHQKGEFQVGPRIRLWCVCGWKWEGEGKRAAEEAWREHTGN